MGYTTDFEGQLNFNKPLSAKRTNYLNSFSSTRRVKRNVEKLMEIHKGKYGKPGVKKTATPVEIYGKDGEYFADDDGNPSDASVVDYNCPPGQRSFVETGNKDGQPGLWCQWEVDENGEYLHWNGAEKFYNYIEWLKYLIKHFFQPWKIKLNGKLRWFGEDRTDIGTIKVVDNEVTVIPGTVSFNNPDDE